MTIPKKYAPYRTVFPAAATLAGILLAGCSSGHVGESWQCPLAKGGSCDSVAAADPAVPTAAGSTVLAEPLYRVRAGVRSKAPAETPCDAECGTGFDPFGWLMRVFEVDPGSGARPGLDPGAGARDEGEDESRSADIAANTPTRQPSRISGPSEPETAPLPGEPDSAGDDLRTGEVVARIWIAPFVDANGVYREAAHVRAVLEPAGWRVE